MKNYRQRYSGMLFTTRFYFDCEPNFTTLFLISQLYQPTDQMELPIFYEHVYQANNQYIAKAVSYFEGSQDCHCISIGSFIEVFRLIHH